MKKYVLFFLRQFNFVESYDSKTKSIYMEIRKTHALSESPMAGLIGRKTFR